VFSPNIDTHEIARFDGQADHWWDPRGPSKSLHDINPLRLKFIESHAGLAGKRVLDVGCGGGILSEAMAARGARVTGIDMSETSLRAARRHARAGRLPVDYLLTTVESMADICPGYFDVVACMELLEHVPRPDSVVRACSRLAAPGGHVFFATLNRNFKSFLFAIIGAEYVLRLLPRGTHRHARFVKPGELAAWAGRGNLACRRSTGLCYNPFTRRYRLCSDTSVNYLMCFCRGD
jgi:2-polyprenyl-6-hydroxyphenyl methylase/3-demethylubiquinone-9 3-methyltransferase